MESQEKYSTANAQAPEDGNSEPITQVQRDSVLTSEDMPPKSLRIGVTLTALAALLGFAALYFGIIHP